MTSDQSVLIIGGGIGGLSAALALRQVGVRAQVFEQAEALKEVGAGVSLWPNAMRALAQLGLAEPVMADHQRLERIVIRRSDGAHLLRLDQPGRYPEPAICVHRAHLQGVLADALATDRLHLGRRLVSFRDHQDRVDAEFHDGTDVSGSLLIGCDGIRSTTRARLHSQAPPRYRGYQIWRGVSPLQLPPELMHQSTEWWGVGRRFGILPGEPGHVFWYATQSVDGGPEFREGAARPAHKSAHDTLSERRRSGETPGSFKQWPFPVPELLAAPYQGDPILTDAEDRPVPRSWGRGLVTLLGDAAHPMTPNMGQGACTAIEDAVVLARCIAASGVTPAALRRFERLRQPRTRRIVRQSNRIGRLGQLNRPALAAMRDSVIRLTPPPLLGPPQRRVYGYRAPEIR